MIIVTTRHGVNEGGWTIDYAPGTYDPDWPEYGPVDFQTANHETRNHDRFRIPLNKWIYIVATYNGDGGRRCIYLNGKLARNCTTNRPYEDNNKKLYVGTFIQGGVHQYPTSGRYDDIRIYNSALSSEKIEKIYAETKHKYRVEK